MRTYAGRWVTSQSSSSCCWWCSSGSSRHVFHVVFRIRIRIKTLSCGPPPYSDVCSRMLTHAGVHAAVRVPDAGLFDAQYGLDLALSHAPRGLQIRGPASIAAEQWARRYKNTNTVAAAGKDVQILTQVRSRGLAGFYFISFFS